MSIRRVRLAEEKYVPKRDVVPKKDVDFETGKTSDKAKKPFDPAEPDPGFDPNVATVTVPSEIQAMTPEQQKHVMNESQQRGFASRLFTESELRAYARAYANNKPVLVGRLLRESMQYLASTARDDVFYAEDPDPEVPNQE